MGWDGTELLKHGGELLISKLHSMVDEVWIVKVMAEKWFVEEVCPILPPKCCAFGLYNLFT